jgi:hypothetical protein
MGAPVFVLLIRRSRQTYLARLCVRVPRGKTLRSRIAKTAPAAVRVFAESLGRARVRTIPKNPRCHPHYLLTGHFRWRRETRLDARKVTPKQNRRELPF